MNLIHKCINALGLIISFPSPKRGYNKASRACPAPVFLVTELDPADCNIVYQCSCPHFGHLFGFFSSLSAAAWQPLLNASRGDPENCFPIHPSPASMLWPTVFFFSVSSFVSCDMIDPFINCMSNYISKTSTYHCE